MPSLTASSVAHPAGPAAPADADPRGRTTHDLVLGWLAACALAGVDALHERGDALAAGVRRALAVCRAGGGICATLAAQCYADVVSGRVAAWDNGVAVAQRYGLASWVSPSFTELRLHLTPRLAARLLGDWPEAERQTLTRAAAALRRPEPSGPARGAGDDAA